MPQNRWRDVLVHSKYFGNERVPMNFHTKYMENKYNKLSGNEKFWIAFLQETSREDKKGNLMEPIPVYQSLRANSEFNQRLKSARASNFDVKAHGPFALFLEWIGIRQHGSERNVGDTP